MCRNLLSNDGAILIEGIHCSYPLYSKCLVDKKVILRTHNIESFYYLGLAKTEKNFLKKIYFYIESLKLKVYEKKVYKIAQSIAAISETDANIIKKYTDKVFVIYPFHENDTISIKYGKGKYALIHGDLSVSENIHSILWLVENVISKLQYKFIIAGKNPKKVFSKFLSRYENIKLIPNPSSSQMNELIENAHINVIHSFYPQGMKLKLLNSLFRGRFVIVSSSLVRDEDLMRTCFIAQTSNDFLNHINNCFNMEFSSYYLEVRQNVLSKYLSENQIKKILHILNDGNN